MTYTVTESTRMTTAALKSMRRHYRGLAARGDLAARRSLRALMPRFVHPLRLAESLDLNQMEKHDHISRERARLAGIAARAVRKVTPHVCERLTLSEVA